MTADDTAIAYGSKGMCTCHRGGARRRAERPARLLSARDNRVPRARLRSELDYIPNEGRAAQDRYAMSDSLGFGGYNAVPLLGKWEGRSMPRLDSDQIAGVLPHRYQPAPVDRIADVRRAIPVAPERRGKPGFSGAVRNARFKRRARPGDVLEFEARVVRMRASSAFVEGAALVAGEAAATVELTLAFGSNEAGR